MNKQAIIAEIKKIAAANAGRPPGEKLFCSETGVRQHEWRGRYWARWGDAIRDAGFEPNKWVEAFPESLLIEKYVELARDLGRLPTISEIQLRARADDTFPSVSPFTRIGRPALLEKAKAFCASRAGYDAVLEMCEAALSSGVNLRRQAAGKTNGEEGFVYLFRFGRFYKIGRSVSVGQRQRQLQIQLPEKLKTVHAIRTDDPIGIEAYWHKRFENKRKNGEWFDLSAQDVSAFKRRRFM